VTRHLVKLMWNRKRANALIALEVFFSFLVLFGVGLLTVTAVASYRKPHGYTIDDVWVVEIGREAHDSGDGGNAGNVRLATTARVLAALRSLEPVVSAAGSSTLPYSNSTWRSSVTINGRHYVFDFNRATDDFRETLRLPLLKGRWFSKEDDGAAWVPTVLTRDLAEQVFGKDDPIGKEMPQEPPRKGETPSKKQRVVGVLTAYRAAGEFGDERGTAFFRSGTEVNDFGPTTFAVRVRPGTRRAFEETLVKALNQAVPDWSFSAKPLAEARESSMRERLVPIVAAGTVAGFLVLMVALGLTGILWQNVTKRRREIGLRRAMGATSARISRQVAAEIWIVTTLAILVGVVLVVQLPLFATLDFVTPALFYTGLGLAVVTLYGVCTVCAVYPGWLAGRVPPSESLRYE